MQPFEQLLQVHDAGVGQYPLGNFENMAKVIMRGMEHFHDKMEYNGREFSIATDVKIGFDWKNMVELPDLTNYSVGQLGGELPKLIEEAGDKRRSFEKKLVS